MSSDAIATDVVDGVAIIEWHEYVPGDAAIGRQVEELLGREDIDAYVAVDEGDRYFDAETQEAIDRMAAVTADSGVERVAIVAEAIKTLVAQRSFEDQGLDVYTTEDREVAVEWAKDGG